MNVNAEFHRRAVEHGSQLPWVPSPMAGVSRRMLDRIGDEVARATSLVRYDAGSQFSPHTHSGGEEFLVLDGVFQDEHGDFPTGTYVRNPIGTQHTPASADGCEIFVKLWQFDPAETKILRVDTNALALFAQSENPGVSSGLLFEDQRETVSIERWEPNTRVTLHNPGGVELLVLDGDFAAESQTFSNRAWLRLPEQDSLTVEAGNAGTRVWRKSGHLSFVTTPDRNT